MILPVLGPAAIEPLLDRLSGLCLSGGPDIDPDSYGESSRHPRLGPTEPEVDRFELALLRAADARRLPVLAICRGMQALNLARGGGLHQHVPDLLGAVTHRRGDVTDGARHSVRVDPESHLARALGRTQAEVDSYHHQAVSELGQDLRPVAWAPDGLVEGLEAEDRPFMLGVQWHAEALVGNREQEALFEALVNAAGPTRGRGHPRAGDMTPPGESTLPDWAHWRPDPERDELTVGIEEEVMLLDPAGWSLSHRGEEVLAGLGDELPGHTAAETHASALELRTDPWAHVGDAAQQLRAALPGWTATCAGWASAPRWRARTRSRSGRTSSSRPAPASGSIYDSMRELARREPTFALHVHVMVEDPEAAVRLLNRLRAHMPLLLALSANSPFWQGRDSGLASARTPLFGAFPRVGTPRSFDDYADYVEAVDLLIRAGAFPEPTCLWWDVRLQPRYGTVEGPHRRCPDDGRVHGRDRRPDPMHRPPRARRGVGLAGPARDARGAGREPLPGLS